jgi:RimJ/RimL family protein N-acetyltransferase
MMGPSSDVAPLLDEFDGLDRADLSPWFNPFLLRFAAEARRCGGEARIVRDGGSITGLMVSDPVERVATIFTRSRSVAESFVRGRGSSGMYSDFPFEPPGEPFDILFLSLTGDPPSHRFRHPLRPFSREDLPAALELMREVYGVVNDRWFQGLPTASEAGFVAQVEGRLAGVAWVSLVQRHARLHSLTVRAPYRRLGIGTDLVFGRLLWAHQNGASDAVSEISVRNLASRAAAAQAGMQPVGRICYYPPV